MKKFLRITAILILGLSYAIWFGDGAKTGWTTTQTPVKQVDEITGIEYTRYHDELTFGIELPAAGTVLAGACLLLSFVVKKPKNKSSS